ncbi:MAG: hypothetical protein ACTSYF_03405 [Promethearchaeota archaeon]
MFSELNNLNKDRKEEETIQSTDYIYSRVEELFDKMDYILDIVGQYVDKLAGMDKRINKLENKSSKK